MDPKGLSRFTAFLVDNMYHFELDLLYAINNGKLLGHSCLVSLKRFCYFSEIYFMDAAT